MKTSFTEEEVLIIKEFLDYFFFDTIQHKWIDLGKLEKAALAYALRDLNVFLHEEAHDGEKNELSMDKNPARYEHIGNADLFSNVYELLDKFKEIEKS